MLNRVHARSLSEAAAFAAQCAIAGFSAAALSGAPATVHWPQFRGEQASGIAEGTSLPAKWDGTKGENIRWKTPIPGLSHASPVVWGDRLFISTAVSAADNQSLQTGLFGAGDSADDMTEHAFKLICLDKRTGRLMWEQTAFTGVPKVKRHTKATHANCSPAADDQRVVAFFGSQGLYCYSHDGELKWKKDLGVLDVGPYNAMELQWGFASSPILFDGKVIVQCDVKANAFLAALDAADGREIWRIDRGDVPTWCTPTVWPSPEGPQVLCNGCQQIAAYDLRDGKEIWRLAGGGGIPVPAPVLGNGLAYFTSNHRPFRDADPQQPVFAVKLTARGELKIVDREKADPQMAWMKTRVGAYMQTPLLYGGLLYVCKDNGALSVFDAGTGEEKWKLRLGSGRTGFTASAVAGDEKVYYTSEEGQVFVLTAGKEGEPTSINELGETCLATPAISEGVMYWHTRRHVIAVGGA